MTPVGAGGYYFHEKRSIKLESALLEHFKREEIQIVNVILKKLPFLKKCYCLPTLNLGFHSF